MMKLTAAVVPFVLALSACGGSEPEFAGDSAAMREMMAICEAHGSYIERFRFINSHTQAGHLFDRGWECWCGPNAKGESMYHSHLPATP